MGFLNELPGSTLGHLHLFLRKKMKNPDNAQEGDYAMNILGIESLYSANQLFVMTSAQPC